MTFEEFDIKSKDINLIETVTVDANGYKLRQLTFRLISKMKVRISFGQTMFVSLVVSLLFCNAYAEEPIGKEPIGKEPISKEPIGEEPISKEPIGKKRIGSIFRMIFFSGSCFEKFWSPVNTIHVKYLPTYISSTEAKICADDYASVGRTVCDDHAECLEGDGAIACECKEGALGDGWAISSGCVPGTNVLKHLKIIGLVFVYSIRGRLSSKTVFLLQMNLLCKS